MARNFFFNNITPKGMGESGKIAFLHTEFEGILTGVEGNPFTKFKQ